jgi:undecaprenyl-diphosphatase
VGSFGLVWLAIAVVCAFLWRRPYVVAWVALGILLGDLSAHFLREAIGRPRPWRRYALPHTLVPAPKDPSFPSGHTTIAFACATVLTYLRPRLGIPLFLLAASIGFSRIYVGVHYPLDVLGGAVLGVAVGGAVIALRRLARARRR